MLSNLKWLVVIGSAFTLVACGSGSKGGSVTGNPSDVLATVNGAPITKAEVMEQIKPQFKRIETEIYKMEKSGVEEMIDTKLLETAAKAQGKSVDDYMASYFKDNMKDPSDEEIRKYYDFRKEQMGGQKFEDVKGQIADFLKSNQENALKRKLISGLRAAAKIEVKLEAPRVDVKIGDSPTQGAKGGKVEVIEFTDYQCPFCGRARPTIAQMIETYPKDVTYALKDFPLSFHKDAQKAHEAAHCAGDQDKYWDMNKKLFANQQAISMTDLQKYGKEIGLDMNKFDKCLSSNKYAETVRKNIAEGSAAGVTGTPAFFVNGIMISGARPFADFKELIDAELK